MATTGVTLSRAAGSLTLVTLSLTAAHAEPRVVVVGAGPGGLAAAGALAHRGVRATVVDRAPHVGASWRGHYDRLRLHTPRRLSHLPGLPMPRELGRWVARDDVVRYLELYAAHHRLDLRLGCGVVSLTPTGPRHRPDGWRLDLEDGSALGATHVVVATGYNNHADLPAWPGLETFTGDVVHAAAYRSGAAYRGREVLVVGAGNTGAEIATDLADHGATVRLAVRTPPHILRRSTLGWPTQATGIAVRHLPVRVVDGVSRLAAPLQTPDLTAYGLPRPTTGLASQARRGRLPVQDVGIVEAVRAGRVVPVAGVAAVDRADVVLADGSRVRPEVLLVATGYVRGLEPLVGHLRVLDAQGLPIVHGPRTTPSAPGLHFIGFTNPISGMFRELRIDARRIARVIAG